MLFGELSMFGSPIITKNRNEIFKSLFKSRKIYGYVIIISFKTVLGFIFCRPNSSGKPQALLEHSSQKKGYYPVQHLSGYFSAKQTRNGCEK